MLRCLFVFIIIIIIVVAITINFISSFSVAGTTVLHSATGRGTHHWHPMLMLERVQRYGLPVCCCSWIQLSHVSVEYSIILFRLYVVCISYVNIRKLSCDLWRCKFCRALWQSRHTHKHPGHNRFGWVWWVPDLPQSHSQLAHINWIKYVIIHLKTNIAHERWWWWWCKTLIKHARLSYLWIAAFRVLMTCIYACVAWNVRALHRLVLIVVNVFFFSSFLSFCFRLSWAQV